MSNSLTALPAGFRKVVYVVLFILGIVFTCFQAADGDWYLFAGSLIASLASAMAAANTPPTRVVNRG